MMSSHVIVTIVVLANVVGGLWLIWWTSRGAQDPGQADHACLGRRPHRIQQSAAAVVAVAVRADDRVRARLSRPVSGTREFPRHQALDRGLAIPERGRGRAPRASSSGSPPSTARACSSCRAILRRWPPRSNLFALNCSTCHGSDARGAKGFPNLTDQDWLWGGSEETVYQTIAHGRDGLMPAWGPVLGTRRRRASLGLCIDAERPPVEARCPRPPERIAAGKDAVRHACARRVMAPTARATRRSGRPI